jgi:NTE family protein
LKNPEERPYRVEKAAVLGGGGAAGMAWMIGLLHALQETGVSLADADVTVGTSAGATAATLLRRAGEGGLKDAYRKLTTPGEQPFEARPVYGYRLFAESLPQILPHADDPVRYADGFFALAARLDGSNQNERDRTMRERVGTREWPAGDLRITALGRSAGRVFFGRADGIPLTTALRASSAVPGVWPMVEAGGEQYIDAGVVSATHCDLVDDARRVVVLRPTTNLQGPIARENAVLERALVIEPDEASRRAFGDNPMDPCTRQDAAVAGHRQGQSEGHRVKAYWSA